MQERAREHLKAGKLNDAVAVAVEDVKARPGDVASRFYFAEMLLLSGDLDRADVQFDTVSQQDPKQALLTSLLRQLLRAEKARRQFYDEGRLPEFLDQPSLDLRLRLEASILIRQGNPREAADLLEKAEAGRPRLSGVLNGKEFDDFRDLDDLTASFLEVLTSNGKYYWVPLEQVESVEFQAPTQLYEIVWRAARMSVRNGPDAVVYLPVLYIGSHASVEDVIRLGRRTEWRGEESAPVRGLGQRTFLAGEMDLAILEVHKLNLSPVSEA